MEVPPVSLDTLSGPWTGCWYQNRQRGYMGLELCFSGGACSGGGEDPVGTFRVEKGEYKPDGSVSFQKRYPKHVVQYKGQWDGKSISGTWKIFLSGKGEFEIWPQRNDPASAAIPGSPPVVR